MAEERVIIPSSRAKDPKHVYCNGDRVSAPRMLWYGDDDGQYTDFPDFYGTVIQASSLSVKVHWDLD